MSDREYSEKVKTIAALREMMNSKGWREVMAPWLQYQIDKNMDIRKINWENDSTILRDARSRKEKVDVYQGVLKKPESLIQELTVGGNHGKDSSNE
jgi:hypothetical protein